MNRDPRIFVAGAHGMVGSALVRSLRSAAHANLLTPPRGELDLLDQRAVAGYLMSERPDYIFIASAKVGGIHANSVYRADFIYQNLMIEANLINGAHQSGVQRLMFLGSSCIYPRECPQPIKEEYLLTGPLEPTNEPYAVAKIAGIKLCESFNQQHGRQYVSVMPTNLYGPKDNYDLRNGHVLPSLIRKFHLATLALEGKIGLIERDERLFGPIPDALLALMNIARDGRGQLSAGTAGREPKVEIWGTGQPRREFMFVDDLADSCVHLMTTGYDGPLVNLGCGEDVSIAELAELVRDVIRFQGELVFDRSKPDGTPRKLLDVSRMRALGFQPKVGLAEGIERAYRDYCTVTEIR